VNALRAELTWTHYRLLLLVENELARNFMFQLLNEEVHTLKSQFVTSRWGGIRRANPYAFTEQGVAMTVRSCSIILN